MNNEDNKLDININLRVQALCNMFRLFGNTKDRVCSSASADSESGLKHDVSKQ